MNIGFDAKRAYHNTTGLGYYSRNLLSLMSSLYPDNEYFLFNPKPSKRFQLSGDNLHEIRPQSVAGKLFPSLWRSRWVTRDLKRLRIDLYHGLSHEIPFGIQHAKVKSIVTIHDLIHERYPKQYNPIDVKIYTKKYTNACRHSSHIIAISEQTKQDIIEYYQIPASKITVCYQSADPVYGNVMHDVEINRRIAKYHLPEKFLLSVGTINERKNLLNLCKALFLLRNDNPIPLVVIGKGKGEYYESVRDFIVQHDLEKRVIFLSERPEAGDKEFLSNADLAAIYRRALVMIYPSFFEGFGLPILEALLSELPVITSNVSCMPEVGGDAAIYINPNSAADIAAAITQVSNNADLRRQMQEKGLAHADKFSQTNYASSVMNVYKRVRP